MSAGMAIGSAAPYDIGRSGPGEGRCAVTGAAIGPGERRVVVLLDPPVDAGGGGGLMRVEVGVEAWRAGQRPAGTVFAFWNAVRGDGPARVRPLIDDEELLDLFEQLAAGDSGAVEVGEGAGADAARRRAVFRYLLALVLIRKKKLVYEGGTPADRRRGVAGELVVRVRVGKAEQASMPVLRVVDPGMSDEDVAAATGELGRVMNLDEVSGGGA